MTRKEAVQRIMDGITDEIVIVTTGYLSRDVYQIKDRPGNFYMCGSMGNAFPIGLGVALNTNKKVVVISGDGACLMGLGSLVLGNKLKLKNLRHYIIDNNKFGSTGGQKTASDGIDFSQFFNTKVIKIDSIEEIASPRIEMQPKMILGRFMNFIQN